MAVRVLLLEDNLDDAELLKRILSKDETPFIFLCVDDEPEFKSALNDFKPNIILSDYNLPSYSGVRAIEFVNENYPNIPVIIVSGAIGEEKAVELLRLGARDYVLKDSLARLPVAIRRVIQEDKETEIRLNYEKQLYQSEERIRNILDSALDAVVSMDSSGIVTSWNLEAERMFGYKKEDAKGKNLSDLIIPAQLRESHEQGFMRYLKTRKSHILGDRIEITAMRSDQTEFSVEVAITVINRENEIFFSAFIRDITESKHAADSLRKSEQRFRLLVENSPMCIHEIDMSGRIISMNKAGLEMMGLKNENEVQGFLYLDQVCDGDRKRIDELLYGACQGQASHFEFKAKGLRYQIFKSCFVPIKDNAGIVEKIMGITEDITRQKKHENVLLESENYFRQLSDYDTLTRLPNRRLLNDRLGQAMVTGKRSGRYGALMFLDLDNFKPLNDQFGHNAGDILLVEVARRINGCVREIDTVSRFGGDEFVVMLIELDKDKAIAEKIAANIADKIRVKIAEPHKFLYKQENLQEIVIEYQCTSSIGVVMFFNHENRAEDLLKWADLAMYQAKSDGRNVVSFYRLNSKSEK